MTLNRNQAAYLKRCDQLCSPAQKKIMKLQEKKASIIKEIDAQISVLEGQVNISYNNKVVYLRNIGVPEEEIDVLIKEYEVVPESKGIMTEDSLAAQLESSVFIG